MRIGEKYMKILRINADGTSEFSTNGTEYKVITEIDKDEICKIQITAILPLNF